MDQVTTSSAPVLSEGLKFLLGTVHPSLFSILDEVLSDGGAAKLGIQEKVTKVRRRGHANGFEYSAQDWIQGSFFICFLKEQGFALHITKAENGFVSERWDLYSEAGVYLETHYEAPETVASGETQEMDLVCPILDGFYNFLAVEYDHASKGETRSLIVHSLERYLREYYRQNKRERRRDPLIRHVFNKMLIIEADPVLNWEERQIVYTALLERLKLTLRVKRRAHGRGIISQNLVTLRFRWASFSRRFKARPMDNIRGILYRYTIAKVLWFFNTVKSNLGYSVALAVYGPFTYYFITMPMNPHAMQAVGKVRSTYIDVKSSIATAMTSGTAATESTLVMDTATSTAPSVVTQTAAVTTTPTQFTNPNIIGVSHITQTPGVSIPLSLSGKSDNYRPQYLNLLLTTDVPAVDTINWNERMGHFKQMQIAYEESLEFAPRLGRIEQLETQYNFPMVVESAWSEMERYNNTIFKLRQREPNLSAKFKQFLTNEVNRTQQLELYLWDRLARFILDQPYVMLDQDSEQKRGDYYIGRAFVFMEEMTQTLTWRYPDFKKPHGFEKITKMSEKYKSARREQGHILANLKANSDLFRQKDTFSTAEFRSTMKRQWEVLYLQNSKVEEASNNGLNMYIWSVRNTIWCLQSMYSAKRQELELFFEREKAGQFDGAALAEMSKTEMIQETLFHNLVLEWVGVKEEIGSRLAKDIETVQRRIVIDNLKESLSDRAKLLNQLTNQTQASVAP